MDDVIELFGRRLPVSELKALIRHALTKQFRDLAKYVVDQCHVELDDIENEAIVLMLRQSRNKATQEITFQASTGIVNCVRYTLLNIRNRMARRPVEVSGLDQEIEQVQVEFATGKESVQEIVARLSRYLSPMTAQVLQCRYGDGVVKTHSEVAEQTGIEPRRSAEAERRALTELVRARRYELLRKLRVNSPAIETAPQKRRKRTELVVRVLGVVIRKGAFVQKRLFDDPVEVEGIR